MHLWCLWQACGAPAGQVVPLSGPWCLWLVPLLGRWAVVLLAGLWCPCQVCGVPGKFCSAPAKPVVPLARLWCPRPQGWGSWPMWPPPPGSAPALSWPREEASVPCPGGGPLWRTLRRPSVTSWEEVLCRAWEEALFVEHERRSCLLSLIGGPLCMDETPIEWRRPSVHGWGLLCGWRPSVRRWGPLSDLRLVKAVLKGIESFTSLS